MNHQQFKFVLVETSHPGNIGAAARAVKTMGFTNLSLVNPKSFPCEEAMRRAAGAADVLQAAQVVSSLDAAISDCHLVVGTSVRDRSVAWPTQVPREMADQLRHMSAEDCSNKIAIVFGRERTGLLNAELDKTQIQVRIPANPDYSSLNLASAVQLIAYELHCALLSDDKPLAEPNVPTSGKGLRQRLATTDELKGYYEHLVAVLEKVEFSRESPPTKLMRKIVRLYNRANINIEELNILRGMLATIDKKIKE